jgi:hypothetical protein
VIELIGARPPPPGDNRISEPIGMIPDTPRCGRLASSPTTLTEQVLENRLALTMCVSAPALGLRLLGLAVIALSLAASPDGEGRLGLWSMTIVLTASLDPGAAGAWCCW